MPHVCQPDAISPFQRPALGRGAAAGDPNGEVKRPDPPS
jgi:hypothetical protein